MDPASLICVDLYYIFSPTIFDFHSGSAICKCTNIYHEWIDFNQGKTEWIDISAQQPHLNDYN